MATGTNSANKDMKFLCEELEVNGSPVTGDAPAAEDVTVAAGTDGLDAGDLQTVLQALATRIQALEDAA